MVETNQAEATGVPESPGGAPPDVWTRLGAFAIDWTFLMFIGLPASGLLAAAVDAVVDLGYGWSALFPVAVTIVYFGVTWGVGGSLGMRITGLRLVRAGASDRPGLPRGLLRGSAAVIAPVALIALAFVAMSDGSSTPEFRERDEQIAAVMLPVSAVALPIGLAIHLSQLLHPGRRAVHDRVSGVEVVRALENQG